MNRQPCQHPDFEAFVRVARCGHGHADNPQPPWRYMADVHVRCIACKTRFQFLGMDDQMGLSWSKPMASVDRFELRAPIEPNAHVTSLMAGDDTGWPGPPPADPAGVLERAIDELTEVAKALKALEAGTLNVPELARRRMQELGELQQLIVAFADHHAPHVFAEDCPACKAEKRIRELAKTFRKPEAK